MNIFVLCTGRCGSTTFYKACSHIDNYTSAHESRSSLICPEHFNYPLNHIEVDNRLSWFLGKLDDNYGDDAFYVHLKRDILATAQSFLKRWDYGIIGAYSRQIIMGQMRKLPFENSLDVCIDYCETVNSNINLFLKDKNKKMIFLLENADKDFKIFWDRIHADGNFNLALSEWKIPYNASHD